MKSWILRPLFSLWTKLEIFKRTADRHDNLNNLEKLRAGETRSEVQVWGSAIAMKLCVLELKNLSVVL